MTETEKEQRRYALAISGGVCEVCGRPLRDGQPQGAHRIGNTKANRAKWGNWIIDHTLNGEYVCSLKCNDAMNIGNNPGKCLELIQRIINYEQEKF